MPKDSAATQPLVDPDELREQVKEKYKEVAIEPGGEFHFHTGRYLAQRLGYAASIVDPLPDVAVESFAGVANPHSMRALDEGARIVDAGSGAGFDSFVAAAQVGPTGQVIGIDMTEEMLEKSRKTSRTMALNHVEFREGLLEEMPVEDGWADILISNGVFNLCPDKQLAFAEAYRVLRPGGRLQFADIANGKEVPEGALNNIDLWTAWIAGGLPCAGWQKMLEDTGFVNVSIGEPVDTFGGASGESNARAFEVYGYAFLAFKPD